MRGIIEVFYFDAEGRELGTGARIALPDYLDRIDIGTKVYWFIARGYGDPGAVSVLFKSQGQQYLITKLQMPLRNFKYKELKENEDDLKEQVLRYHEKFGRGSIAGSQ